MPVNPVLTQPDVPGTPVPGRGGPELSIVVPTFNEAANVQELVARLDRTLAGIVWEVLFVDDDSPDGTADAVRTIARRDSRVRCIQRIGRRGLSSACVEGILAASAPYLVVMDADLQHEEALLGEMLRVLKSEPVDLVIGSRYAPGGGVGDWEKERTRMSRWATALARVVLKRNIADPMSGFFMLKAEVLQATVRRLSSIGFKILLDILVSAPGEVRVRELPYHFRERHAGESKLDSKAMWDYFVLLLDKTIGRFVPTRFIVFLMVGGVGVFVHLAVLALLYKVLTVDFLPGQTIATFAAMTFNFAVNNELTYRDLKLSGWSWLRGWATFVLACSVGALANVGIAGYLFEQQTSWLISAIAGILLGAAWNYGVTSVYTWKAK